MRRITLELAAPYVGLRPFSEREALLFFGRDNHVKDLVAKLQSPQRFIAVLGESGSGKSSLIRAGLVPALHRGVLPTRGDRWNVCVFTPGAAPINNLAQALIEDPRWSDDKDRATSISWLSSRLVASPVALADLYRLKADSLHGEALLLVVDQFEEIFRYRQRNVDEAESFINLLLRSSAEDVPIYVVTTMRSDFLGNCTAFVGLPEAINSGIYLTPRLGPDQLKAAIASPVALVGGEIDPVLTNRIVNTLTGEDELPVLQHALLRMWNRARAEGRERIETADFEAICAPADDQPPEQRADVSGPSTVSGGPLISYAIDNHASDRYRTLDTRGRSIARELFVALVDRRDGRDARRPQEFREIVELVGEGEREVVQKVIEAFRAEGVGFLLPPANVAIDDQTVIDISHESLIRRWRWFQQWLTAEGVDVTELREWHLRAARRAHKTGSWLDESDCALADNWRARVEVRSNPAAWAKRHTGADSYAQVSDYIRMSRVRLEAELVRIERRVADTLAAEELVAAAESMASDEPDLALLLGIAAWRFIAISKAGSFLRWARGRFTYRVVLRGHEGPLSSIQWSPDGETLLTASEDKTARLWNAASGEPLRVLHGHEGPVDRAQWSSNGQIILTASADNTARLWDAASGRELRVLRGHEGPVASAQWSPNGQIVLTASADGTARLWDAASGRELRVLRGHKGPVASAQWSPNGQIVLTADRSTQLADVPLGSEVRGTTRKETLVTSMETTVRLWDATDGLVLHVLSGNGGPGANAHWSPDGKTVLNTSVYKIARRWDAASGSEIEELLPGHTARLWDAASGRELKQLSGRELKQLLGHDDAVLDAQWSQDGSTIMTASADGTGRLWDVANGIAVQVLRGHADQVVSVQGSADGKLVLTGSWDNTSREWDIARGRELRRLRVDQGPVREEAGRELQMLRGHEGPVIEARWSPDSKSVATASWDKSARLWDAAAVREVLTLHGHEGPVSSALWSHDGETLLTASADKTARLWNAASGGLLRVLDGHEGAVASAQWSRNDQIVLTASADRTVRMWDAGNGKMLQVFRGHQGPVTSAQWSPDGQIVLTASADKTVRFWDPTKSTELLTLNGHEGSVASAQWSPDGKTVLTAGADTTLRLWDATSSHLLKVLRGHEGPVEGAHWSPDGKTVVSASQDKTARLWDAASGKELRLLRGHGGAVLNAQWSLDGKTIVTASADGTARLWDAASGKEVEAWPVHDYAVAWAQRSPDDAKVHYAQLSPDGTRVVTAGADMTVRLWRCATGRAIKDIVAELGKAVGRNLTEDEIRKFAVPTAASS